MKKLLFALFISILVGGLLTDYAPAYNFAIKNAPSEIVGREDLMGRNEYLQLLTQDPATGQVPPNIKRAELQFDRRLSLETLKFRAQQTLEAESAGPANVGGRTRAVAFDVRDENIMIAGGVSGGVWKSIDGGNTWTRKSNPENRNGVTCIVQDTRPGREDTWYHGTGEIVGNSARGGGAPFRGNGIYKSTDNGETWNPLPSTQDADPQVFNSQFQYVWDIEVNPGNLVEDEVLAATYGGILRSADGGTTWEVEVGQMLFNLDESVNLNQSGASFYTALERSKDNVFYATLSTETGSSAVSPHAGIYYSLDGKEWVNITPSGPEWLTITGLPAFPRYRRTVIGVSPSNPDLAYFMVDSNPIFILEHRLSQENSPDRINGFEPSSRIIPQFGGALGNLDTQGSYNMMIRVHPEDENTVFVGGTNIYRSTDGFRTAENIDWVGGYNPEGGVGVYPNHHPDQHELLFLPSNPDVAISASDGGLIRSDDIRADSVIWSGLNDGFITSQFFTIAQSKTPGDETIIGGMQDNGTDMSIEGNTSWSAVIGGDGAYAATTQNNTLWYASFQNGQTLRLTLNDDYNITSFARVDPGGLVSESASRYLFVNPFVLDPKNENRMFCAGGNHLYYHPNVSQIPGGSQTPTTIGWIRVNEDPIEGGLVSAIEASFEGEKIYYGTSGGQVFRLDNATSQPMFSLTEITSELFPEKGYVTSISVNPDNDQHVIVAFSNYSVPSLFESMNGGSSFIDISGNLEENPDGTGNGPSVRWVEIIPKLSGNLLLVGTSVGLYSTEDASATTTWVKESPTTIGSSVITMMDYRPNDGRLAIATHGNGVYTTNISGFKPMSLEKTVEELFSVNATYPNPFFDNTYLEYSIPVDGEVRIDILYPNGVLINTILWGPQFAGTNTVAWDGKNTSGTSLANGMYFYRIQYGGQKIAGRIVLRR
ncbi:MAG: FlgD immunoglobulin-like domain containing protein [Ekhidna sp.]